jgi:hypothetical protein
MDSPNGMSANVEDRRGQSVQEVIAELMKYANAPETPDDYGEPMMQSQGGYQTIPGLELPSEFTGSIKRSR